ncbi:MAG TPA: ABC transporter substrate-binding protein [Xanthobacteraceae bacterium]|nr:ABC transporter substrate-binding protein [Xanthobacteraceae bacterium]
MRVAASLRVLAALSFLSAAARAQTPWHHGIIEAKSDAGFQVMAVRGGFAQKLGLDLKYSYFQNDVIMLRAMLAGELDSYEGTPGPALVAGARNAGVKILGCQWQNLVHSVFARAEFKGPADLKGATMAISAPNAAPDLIAKAYLAQNHIPLGDVKFASLGNDPDRYKAVAGGIALATVISIEFSRLAARDGIKLVARGSDVMPNYPRLCTMTTEKAIAARRDAVVRFLAAQMQGYRHALDHRDQELAITREITGIKPDDTRPEFMFGEAANPKTGIDPAMPISLEKLDWLQGELVAAGNIAQKYDVARAVDGGPRAEALRRAGMAN